jgi:uncharacterized protein YecT (DUF1311 family)
MKKYLIVILATLLLLTSCAKFDYTKEADKIETKADEPIQNDATPSVDDDKDNIDNLYFGQYQMSEDGFSNLVKDNAIDRDYKIESDRFQKSTEFNTQGWIEIEDKYSKAWDKELNNIYKKLLTKLNEAEKKELTDAQKGWALFHINESEFVSEAWSDLGLGSQGKVQLVMAQKERIRIRTLQLMEYYHMLGGEIEFLYKGMNE